MIQLVGQFSDSKLLGFDPALLLGMECQHIGQLASSRSVDAMGADIPLLITQRHKDIVDAILA